MHDTTWQKYNHLTAVMVLQNSALVQQINERQDESRSYIQRLQELRSELHTRLSDCSNCTQ